MIKKIGMFFWMGVFIFVLNSCTSNSEEDGDNYDDDEVVRRFDVAENGWKGITFAIRSCFDTQNRYAIIIGVQAGAFFEENLVLPTTFQNVPITRIADDAFRNPSHADPNHRIVGINGLNLSYMHYLEYIGNRAFQGSVRYYIYPYHGSWRILSVIFGSISNLRKIGNSAFENNWFATALCLDGLPALYSIGNSAFRNSRIIRLYLGQLPSLRYIGSNAFTQNTLTSNIIIEDLPSLEVIGALAFATNGFISSLEMSNLPSLTRIEDRAFRSLGWGGNAVQIINLDVDLSNSYHLIFIANGAFSHDSDTDMIRQRYGII